MSYRAWIPIVGFLCIASSTSAQPANETSVFICGFWPNRIAYFDPEREEFEDAFRVRYGAITNYAHTPDKRLFFFVTDRMEAVEVADPKRREVIDELKLSTPGRRVRIRRVVPDHQGKRLYLSVNVMRLEPDRFVKEDIQYIVYDLQTHGVVESFVMPEEVSGGRGVSLHVSPDGASLYAIGRDIYELDARDRTILRKKVVSKPRLAGYGAPRLSGLTETEPGVFYGIYRTTDPVLEKSLVGLAHLDLYAMELETFELAPELHLGRFALSPDGKRGYAGFHDAIAIDMESKRVVALKKGFERGATNRFLIVSADGKRLYVAGVGDRIWVYDTETLEHLRTVVADGDFMMGPIEIPDPGPPTAASARRREGR